MSDGLAPLREALQDHLPVDEDEEDESLGVLTGYVVLAQFSDADGREWMTRTAGTINDEGPSIWTVKGWLYHALDTVQRDADEEEEQ